MENHCRKCGRRSRKHDRNSDRLKCQREQQRLIHTEFPSYPIVTQTNDNHSKSENKNVIIDQLIEVQQVNCINNQNDEYRRFTDRLKRAQQMIYLRENINNLTYREIHFPNEYVIVKRLEEKNHLIHQNRFSVDHYFRPLKLQYQTISTSFQHVPVTSFTYSKEDTAIAHPLDENHSTLAPTVDINDTMSTDSTILDRPYQEFKHQNYSQNAVQSLHLTESKNRNLTFETAVIVDVRKCPQATKHHSPIQLHWNHITPTSSTSPLNSNQQLQTKSFLRSHNSNQTSPSQLSKIPSITRNYLSDISSSVKYTETLHKLKQILDALQKHLLKRSRSNEIDQSTSITMTSDSLATAYSVSSTVPISQIEVDSLNQNYYSNRIKLRNSAKNSNCNQQISDDEITENSIQSPSRRSMPPSFMFILQILLVLCLIDRLIVYHILGIVLTEPFLSTPVTVNHSQSIAAMSSAFVKKTEDVAVSENNEKILNWFKNLAYFVFN